MQDEGLVCVLRSAGTSQHEILARSAFSSLAAVRRSPPRSRSSTSPDQAALVQGNNAFAIDLYGQFRQQPGNLFFSPESISTAFAMAYAGAHGQTATEMAATLHFTLPPDQLHPAMGALLARLNAAHKGYELHVADALWAQNARPFCLTSSSSPRPTTAPDFIASTSKPRPMLRAQRSTSGSSSKPTTRSRTCWGPAPSTPETRLVLTNAIYFKGDWAGSVRTDSTQEEDFHLSATQSVKAPLMHRTGGYSYYDGGTFQALELPYQTGELSMVVLLPKEYDGLPALEKSFTADNAAEWLAQLQHADKVILSSSAIHHDRNSSSSTSALAAMGMAQAFQAVGSGFLRHDRQARFLHLGAIHKAYINVNEEGTEAAAATGIMMEATAMRHEPPPIVFRADHPFLFLIRDNKSGGILFMGRVTDPTK